MHALAARVLVLFLAALAAAGCRSVGDVSAPPSDTAFDPDAPPPIPPKIDPSHLHFTRSQVQVGDVAPEFVLLRTDGLGALSLASLRGRPAVVVFGSFT